MTYTKDERSSLHSMFHDSSAVVLSVESDSILLRFIVGSRKFDGIGDDYGFSYYLSDSLEMLSVSFRLVRSAIFGPYDDLPLMISHPVLGTIARWRFLLGR